MLKTAALKYASMGFSIFPLHPKSKRPLLEAWKPFSISLPSLEKVSDWWSKTPNANIALPTGPLNRIVVVDLDGPEGLVSAKALGLYSPVQSVTGRAEGGRQLFFKWPGEKVCGTVGKLPGVDIRGDGNYVVLPPSVHPETEKRYQWMSLALGAIGLPEFPVGIFSVMPVNIPKTSAQGWISEALTSLSEGNRNDTFFRIASRLRNDGHTSDDICAILHRHATECGFPETELRICVDSASRYEPKQNNTNGSYGNQRTITLRTWENSKEEYEKRKTLNAKVEFPTPFKALTRLTNGFQRREVTIIASRTGIGKTNIVASVCRTLLGQLRRLLVCSTEMSFDRLYDRIGVEASRSSSLFICDELLPTAAEICNAAKEVKADVVVFDHINHIGDDYDKLSAFAHGLKNLATELDIPVIVTAQLSRAADQTDMRTGKKIAAGMHMIKGSGTIEQIAAQVLLVSEIGRDEQQIDLEAHLTKNRYGEQGKFYLKLLRNPWRLEECL